MKYLFRVPTVLALLLTALTAQAHDIEISDAWIRAAPPNAPALGAFMQIENSTDADRYVVAARTSLDVDRVELHRTMMQDGIMQMVPHDKIPLTAGTRTMLKPGSWHVMLIGPKTVPTEGETVTLTLVFDDGSEQTIDALVRKGKKMKHGMQGHGSKHDCRHGQAQHKKHGQKHRQNCGHDGMQMQGHMGQHDCKPMHDQAQVTGHERQQNCGHGTKAN